MSASILSLESSDAHVPVAGGKGASLSELLRAGMPVPAGFIITAAAYRAFLRTNDLERQIVELSNLEAETDLTTLEAKSQAIQDLLRDRPIPRDLADAITGAYRKLTTTGPQPSRGSKAPGSSPGRQAAGSPAVAVRSSATSEDLADTSSAGQHATFLNVRGDQALLTAVKECWSSLWATRAMAYRQRQPVDLGSLDLAVVVQQMVPSQSAGTLFTVNPVDGAHEVIINAVWGLGTAVADGTVTPDSFVFDRATGLLGGTEINDKPVMAITAPDGVTEVPVESKWRREPVLTEEQAEDLARLGMAIETRLGGPQDIEWAIAEGCIYILQSRPVTTLNANQSEPSSKAEAVPGDDGWPALEERAPQPFDLWTQAVVGEAWPTPVSPMMWSGVPTYLGGSIRYALRGLNSSYLDEVQWAKRFYGRVYYNEGGLAHVLSHDVGLPGTFVDSALGLRRNPGADPQQYGRARPARLLRRLPFLVRMGWAQMGTGRELKNMFPQIDVWVRDFDRENLDALDDQALWEAFLWWVGKFQRVINLQSEINGIALTSYSIVDRLLARWFHRPGLAQDLVGGLDGVYTSEIGPALSRMADLLRGLGLTNVVLNDDPTAALEKLAHNPEASPFLQELNSFLLRYGHRCANEGEWLSPRWADAPEDVTELLASYLRAEGPVNPKADVQRRRREEATVWVESKLGRVRRAIFRLVLRRAQHAVRLRENGKHYYMKLALPIRWINLAFGQRWADRGWLVKADDIFFLTIPDVIRVIESGSPAAAGLNLIELAARRREAFLHWAKVKAPELIGADERPLQAAAQPPEGAVLVGTPVSAGQVRGKARIILDPRRVNLVRESEILVTRATDPGWTAVFPLLSGLVLEVGGQLSHAAIVAREYGLPAVVNVRQATSRIRDGQTITVDGTTGQVYLDSMPEDAPVT